MNRLYQKLYSIEVNDDSEIITEKVQMWSVNDEHPVNTTINESKMKHKESTLEKTVEVEVLQRLSGRIAGIAAREIL